MAQRILVIEDEPAIAETTLYALGTEGFEAVWAATGQAALAMLQSQRFDLAVLDVGLPDVNGFDLFRQIGPQLPVIFLTARSGEIDRIVGLELGADDYVAKPFSPRELCARVRTVLRRVNKPQAVSLTPTASPLSRVFQVDEERKRICFLGVALELSRTEYRLLKVLVGKPGRVFTREELMDKAWEHPEVSLERTVDAHIKMLRAKLRAVQAGPDPIITHRGLGYSLRE